MLRRGQSWRRETVAQQASSQHKAAFTRGLRMPEEISLQPRQANCSLAGTAGPRPDAPGQLPGYLPDPPAFAPPSATGVPRATTGSAAHRPPPAKPGPPPPTHNGGATPEGQETHSHTLAAAVALHALRPPWPRHRHWSRRRAGCSAWCSPGPRSGAGRYGPARALKACCDTARSARYCSGSGQWGRPGSRKGRGSSPPPVGNVPGNAPCRGPGQSRSRPTPMVRVFITH